MKRPVSLVAFLVSASTSMFLMTGCGAAPAGKAEFAEACHDRMGGKIEKCDCYVASVEQALPADQFAVVAQGAHDNKGMNGMVPQSVMTRPGVSDALAAATQSCFTSNRFAQQTTG